MLLCQISDPHIVREGSLAYGRVDTPAMLERALRQIAAQDPAPDALVITGDLTDHGEPAEYALLAELLAPLTIPVYLLAGNHDERGALQAAFPQHAWMRGEDGLVQYVIEEHELRLVALDTTVPGRPGGELCSERLQWLDRVLAQSDRPTIVAQHHPPLAAGLSIMDRMTLANPADEAAVIARHPQVERVIAGHYHRAFEARFAGTIASVCPSTAQQLMLMLGADAPMRITFEPPGYLLHRWDGRTLVTHHGVIGEFPNWGTRD